MAVSGTVQALIAAFFFGILVNTASAGFIIYIKGYGSAIFRDGLRLALILFLASAALWAQVEFLTTLIEPTASSTCQVAVILSALLDQFARVSIEQFLIWAVARDGLKSAAGLATQVLLLARFVIGMVFVGETKPQFNNTCVPLSNVVPVAIAVIALDAVILIATAILALTAGANKNGPSRRTILVTISALAIWMGTSVTMLLGLSTIDMFFRTTLPAIGLFIMAALVTLLSGSLVADRERRLRLPESPTPQNMNRDMNLSTSDSNEYAPSRYEEVKGMSGMTMTAFQGPGAQMDDTNAGLPTLARPVTGLVGIGGVPVQGQLFPPLRANTDLAPLSLGDVKTRIDLPKRTKSGPPKVGKGKLAISAPIPINDPEAQNAFSKIPTVDLATAAKNEQERREGYARRVSLLIANRPAPKPPLNTSVAGNLSTGLSRKEIVRDPSVEIERSDSMKYSQNGGLSVEGNASSTSAQLSPGSEELRRRSPRQPVPTNPPAKTPTFQPITPGQSFRIPIPRAQPPPEPASGRIPEPVKTPLLRRPTNGLPSNPRAQTTKKPAEQLGNSEPQTVMFINRISYDDPSYVNDIIQEATKTPFTPLRSSNSVVHRPRPIPRKGDRDRQVFPAEISTSYGHRRTKSGGSIIRTQSILQSQTGSPTPLPPLPPPQSAGNTLRPQPNDTKSMTFDEKMSMFYTGPPSASSVTSATRRRSSVPDLPPLPPTFLPAVVVPPVQQPAETDNEHRLARTTSIDQSSIRTHSILGVEDLGDKYLQSIGQSPAGELGNSWLPGLPSDYAPNPVEYEGNRRQSSPIIPAIRYSNLSSTSDAKTYDDDAAANWGSVHSPIAPFNLSASRLNAQSTYNNKDPRLGSILSGFGDEVMTVMLDTNSEFASNNRQSFLLDNEDSVPDVPKVEQRGSGQWHHLIGEDCPTFSTRKQKVKSRKMPPPAPLLLRAASNKNAMIIHTAEPSPVESPNAAYNMIQAQLRNLDEPSRDSVASGGRRLALLEDLELEMGQQESRWQTMQHNLDRDSISTIQTDSRPVSIVTPPRGVTRSSSTKSILAERRASRRSRMLKEAKSRDDLLAGAVSSIERLDNSRASLFQTRLAAAQLEFTENAADMIMKRNNLNFFSVSKADLGSPTPPDSDESDEEIFSRFESLNAKIAQSPPKEIHFLWQPAAPVITFSNQLLWKAPVNNSEIVNHVALPGLSVRPAARKSVESLPIESSDLWQKLSHPSKPRPGLGLWCKASPEHLPEPQAIQNVRPLTQRPPRRSKRVTLLPDIVENPEPLPNKRGTLGIFQFPWGERSENATVQPRKTSMTMPGTMSSGRFRTNAALEARASQLEAEEYSSSFFDDYDEEEDEGDNFDDEYEDSGDEFDENTLWEIASLLRTDVPSKNSLFLPELGSSVIDEYIVEESSEDEGEMLFDATFHDVSEETPTATPLYLRTQDEVIRTSLWAADDQATLSRTSFGLQQPEEGVWQSYIPSDAGGVRSRSAIGEPAQLESDQLWMSTSQALSVKSSLWMPTSWPTIDSRHFGLSQPDLAIWEMYLPDNAGIIRSQSRIEEPGTIQSTSLWQATRELVEDVQSSLWAAPSLKIEAHMNAPLSTSPSLQPERGDPAWEKKYLVLPESEASDLSITNITKLDSGITPAAPVAVSTVTKSSANEEPVHKFTAQRLWKNTPKLVARTTGKRQTMWSPTSVRVANTTGLFHVEAQRKNYKTTTADPAALKMTTKPRKSSAPLSQLLTTQFWNPVGQEKVEADWIRISSGQGLLSRPSSSTTSLFQIDSDRKQWRTTLAEPAALQMTIKSRTVLTPMPTLESDRLWYPTRATDDDFDWITISSVRPRSPSILSIASTDSTLSSPVTDASSIRTASTKASTVALSVSSFTNVRDFFEQRKKAGSVFPEVPEEGEIPDIPEEPLVATNFDYIPSSEYTQVPYRLRIATSADWELALQEAIEASHMSPKIVRGTASPKEWSIALNQAITASYPRNRFSRGQVLPAQWDEELCEAIAKTQRPLFDVSKRHPVFFGSMTTTSADVHPAMFGMALQALSIAAEQSSL